jgi:hypothetical protein
VRKRTLVACKNWCETDQFGDKLDPVKHERPKVDADFPQLTKRQMAELHRRVADMKDPRRYVIVSSFLPKFSLFYCPSDGAFVMNEIPDAALFKRKAEALAVARALEHGQRKRGKGLQVIQVKKTPRAVRILEAVHVDGRAWKPKLRRR